MTNAPGTDPAPTTTGMQPAAPAPQPVSPTIQPADAPQQRPASGKGGKSGGKGGSVGTIVLVVGLVVAIGGVAFAVGRVTAPAASAVGANRAAGANGVFGNGVPGALPNGSFDPAALPNGSFAPGAAGFRGALGGLGGLTGTVTAITADTLTIQVGGASGRTVEIPLSSSTAYHTEQAATAADVKVGAEVTVRTQRNTAATGGTNAPPAGRRRAARRVRPASADLPADSRSAPRRT